MEYEVSRRTGKCTATSRDLAEGEVYYAVLFETSQGFERRDYCAQAWTGPPDGNFCYWRARVPVRDKKPTQLIVDHELLMHIFTRLEDDPSQSRQQFRFVLALLLMRKRLLKLDQTIRENGQEWWLVHSVADQNSYRVVNPELSSEAVERLGVQMMALLTGDATAMEAISGSEPTMDTAPPVGQTPGGQIVTDSEAHNEQTTVP